MKYYIINYLSGGKKNRFETEAENKKEAINKLKSVHKGAIVLKTDETELPASIQMINFFKDKIDSFSSISLDEKIATIRQIAVMTDAGISIYDSIIEVSTFAENPKLKSMYLNIANDIGSGKTIVESIKVYEKEFGHIVIGMTNLGEQTGNLSESYHKLADILENSRDNTKAFKKAVRGPVITLIAMAFAFVIMIVSVVPKFKDIFEKFDTELPIATKILLWLEHGLSNYGFLIGGVIIGIVVYIKYIYATSKKSKFVIDKMLLSPNAVLINKIIFLSSIYQYLLVFSELISSGIQISESLEISIEIVENSVLKEKLSVINQNITKGMSLSEAFKRTGLLQNMLLQMIKSGEDSGQLDSMFKKVVGFYELEFNDLIDNISSYIEPILLFFVAALVVLLALGIFMPMWNLGGAIN